MSCTKPIFSSKFLMMFNEKSLRQNSINCHSRPLKNRLFVPPLIFTFLDIFIFFPYFNIFQSLYTCLSKNSICSQIGLSFLYLYFFCSTDYTEFHLWHPSILYDKTLLWVFVIHFNLYLLKYWNILNSWSYIWSWANLQHSILFSYEFFKQHGHPLKDLSL